METPLYLQVADDIRRKVVTGEWEPGSRLPARRELAAAHHVAEGVVREATRLLATEGLIVSRPGAGLFVREQPAVRRMVRSWYRELRGGSPFAADMAKQGRRGRWDYESDTVQAPPNIRARLVLDESTGVLPDVMRTRYVFYADDQPVMVSTSYEPLSLTKGTPIAFPEGGPYAGRGVTERMAAIDVIINDWVEELQPRIATADEAKTLGIAPGSIVQVIERFYIADDRPVETADIVIPGETTRLIYSGPVGE